MLPSESLAEGFDLETAYAQLQAHIEAERWIEAIAVCHRILNRQPGYCDVPQLLDGARRQLGSERERSRMAREAWRGTLAPVMDGAQPRRRRPKLALLIGGLIVKIGDLVLDGSVKAQIEGLKESLRRGEYS